MTVAKAAEKGVNRSVDKTTRQVFRLPTSREMIYKAKAAIDTLCVRFGDGLAAVWVLPGSRLLGARLEEFLWFNIALIGCRLWLAVLLAREHWRLF